MTQKKKARSREGTGLKFRLLAVLLDHARHRTDRMRLLPSSRNVGIAGSRGVDLVALLLKHQSVRELTLSYNRLYIDSGVQLVRLARFNPKVTAIHIVDQPANEVDRQLANHIPPSIVAEMQRHLKYNREEMSKRSMQAAAAGQATASNMLRQKMAGQRDD